MRVDGAVDETASMLLVAALAMQKLVSQSEQVREGSLLPLLHEVEQMAERLSEIAKELRTRA